MKKAAERRKPTAPKRLEPKLECHLRLYDENDHALRIFIEQEARKNERTIHQQLRFMLRQAATHPQRVLMQERD